MDTVKFDWKLTPEHPVKIHSSTHLPGMVSAPSDIHSSIHIGLLLKGDTTGLHNGERISVQENELYLISPWEPHRTLGSKSGNNLLLITADPAALNRLLLHGAQKLNILCRIPPRRRQEILQTVKIPDFYPEKILQLLREEETPERELKLLNAALGIITEIVCADFSAEPEPEYLRLLPALETLGNRSVSVAEAAEKCHLSESRFAHLFRQIFGMPFARYERLYRLRGAFDQLCHEHSGVEETAEKWGFYDKSHFSRSFRKEFGFSPKNALKH